MNWDDINEEELLSRFLQLEERIDKLEEKLSQKNEQIDEQAELIEKQDKLIGGIEKKLGNEGFIAKAPEAVVEKERGKLAEFQAAKKLLEEQQAKIGAL